MQNEVFCIAVCCDLDWETQRKAAWNLVTNMLNGNFRWLSPLSQLSLEKALCEAGVLKIGEFVMPNSFFTPVFFESNELPKRVIEKFDLPTSRLHPNKILSNREKNQREWYNAFYPANHSARTAL
jgi:hypothetical protein